MPCTRGGDNVLQIEPSASCVLVRELELVARVSVWWPPGGHWTPGGGTWTASLSSAVLGNATQPVAVTTSLKTVPVRQIMKSDLRGRLVW